MRTANVRRQDQGFTMVEMMIVVVILSILASLAFVGYGRYIGRARLSEATALLSEMASKEQAYFMEFGHYLPLRGDNVIARPSVGEAAAGFYPVQPGTGALSSTRVSTSIVNPAGWPAGWRNIALKPRRNELYCTYMTNAGDAGQAPTGTFGPALVGVIAATSPPWFYSLAACNLSSTDSYPGGNTILGVSSTQTALRIFNDGQ